MFQGKNLLILLSGIILGTAIAGGMFYLGRARQFSGNGQAAISPEVTPTPTKGQQTGIIEGSLSYPSEAIPESMVVCAETFEGEQVACTDEHITDTKYTYGVGFMLTVSPGSYFVYAQLPDDDYKAYYNEFVECGLSVGCESHEPIELEVGAGETVVGVDPHDWYNR